MDIKELTWAVHRISCAIKDGEKSVDLESELTTNEKSLDSTKVHEACARLLGTKSIQTLGSGKHLGSDPKYRIDEAGEKYVSDHLLG